MALPLLAITWLLAMALVALFDAPGWLLAAALAPVVPVAARLPGRNAAWLAATACVLALIAGVRFERWLERDAPGLAAFVGSEATLEGRVTSDPDPGVTTVAYAVAIQRVTANGGTAETVGSVLIRVGEYTEVLPGDRLRLTGELEDPPVFEEFDYRGYLARRGIVATMLYPRVERLAEGGPSPRRLQAKVRLALEDAMQRALPEPAASLATGITFGRDDTIPDDLYDDFRTTGLAHIVAVSGSNVAIITGLVFMVSVRFMRRQWAILPAAVMLAAYLAIAGPSASVVRAGIMAAIFLAGLLLGRQQSSLAALGGAAILMTLVSPSAALDVGFQLSLSATAGLIVLAPWVRFAMEWALRRVGAAPYIPDLVVQTVALSLSATLATLPITWVNFGQVSLIGLLTNVVVEPVFAVAFWFSALAALLEMAWAPAGWAAGIVTYYPLALIIGLARLGADIPGAAVHMPSLSARWALLAYAVAAAAGWPAYRYLAPAEPRPERPERVRHAQRAVLAGAAGLSLMALLPVTLLPLRGPGDLRVDVLGVGQGDAILLTTPHGHRILVDGGPSGIELARELGAVLPHWERGIDRVILSHPQQDHVAGLPELFRRYDVEAAADNGASNDIVAYGLYRDEGPRRDILHRGDSWTDDGVHFEVLWPPEGYTTKELNDTSLVLRVTYEGRSLLLTGDLEAQAQRALMALEDVDADVLKVPHHGSKSSAGEFFDAVSPALAVISVGADNRFGHPAPETLEELAPTPLYRTDLDGRIRLDIDGAGIRVAAGR
ncbi:MAG: DNA internalization-related competence protein ComEC/Rec2 [Hyphomicrobiales bacterium]